MHPPTSIAVLGGGITGLSAAFSLSRRFPHAQITLFEKTARFGGWVQSRRVEVKDGEGNKAQMLLESGPRTLRPNSGAILELINLLNLQSSVITTPKSSPAAKHRFLFIPGRPGLTRLPSSPLSLLGNPYVASLLLPSGIAEPFRSANRPEGAEDESLHEFLTRRFGASIARIFGSALVHGIYAADSRILSVRAAFPALWEAEERGGGSIVRGMLKSQRKSMNGYDIGNVNELMRDASVYSFRDGMEALTRALLNKLAETPNVTLRTGADVVELSPSIESHNISVRLTNGESLQYSRAVSTIPLPMLRNILTATPSHLLPHLTANPSSTVTVVNIVFPPTKRPIHPPGFGYLVPRPLVGYHVPGFASGFLGTVFDSCALSAQDTQEPSPRKSGGDFTKLTIMLGGPFPITPSHVKIENVLAQLQHHLSPIVHRHAGKRLPWPVYYEATEQRNCIPVPTVGHLKRMVELKEKTRDPIGPWKGKLEIIGAGVEGVSVGDCIEAGRNVGQDW